MENKLKNHFECLDGLSSFSRELTSQQHAADVDGAEITIPNELDALTSKVVHTVLNCVAAKLKLPSRFGEEEDETSGTSDQTIGDAVNLIPLAGHANALLHQAAGNEEGKTRALAAANRSIFVGGAGALGGLLGGPTAAAIASVGAGMATDFVTSIIKQDHDHPDGVLSLFNDHSPDAVVATFRGVVSDALVGYATGTALDRVIRSEDIKAIEAIETRRREVGTADKITNHTVQAVVIDKKTGKKYFGTNQNKRRQSKLNPKIIGPNIFVEKFKADPLPPRSKAMGRHASTCAEAEAYHFMLIDNPNADLSQTLVQTYLRKDGGWKNMERCDNCKARDHAMGKIPTDPMVLFI